MNMSEMLLLTVASVRHMPMTTKHTEGRGGVFAGIFAISPPTQKRLQNISITILRKGPSPPLRLTKSRRGRGRGYERCNSGGLIFLDLTLSLCVKDLPFQLIAITHKGEFEPSDVPGAGLRWEPRLLDSLSRCSSWPLF